MKTSFFHDLTKFINLKLNRDALIEPTYIVSVAAKHELELKIATLDEIKQRICILKNKCNLTNIDLGETAAISREIIRRTLEIRIFDTQILSATLLYRGTFVEMATGEGKTIVAIIAAFFNWVSNRKTHIATTNSYLAERDYLQATKFFSYIEVNISLITSSMPKRVRKYAYNADVVYATFLWKPIKPILNKKLRILPNLALTK